MLDKFITTYMAQTFSCSEDVENYLRETIPALVEEIYKNELRLADERWKRAEEELRKLS